MINVPGTMLVLRRKNRRMGGPGYITLSDVSPLERRSPPRVNHHILTYGDSCMLINAKKLAEEEKKQIQSKSKRVFEYKLLYNNQILFFIASNGQMERWFTYIDLWEKNGYEEQRKKFEKDGLLEQVKNMYSF